MRVPLDDCPLQQANSLRAEQLILMGHQTFLILMGHQSYGNKADFTSRVSTFREGKEENRTQTLQSRDRKSAAFRTFQLRPEYDTQFVRFDGRALDTPVESSAALF